MYFVKPASLGYGVNKQGSAMLHSSSYVLLCLLYIIPITADFMRHSCIEPRSFLSPLYQIRALF